MLFLNYVNTHTTNIVEKNQIKIKRTIKSDKCDEQTNTMMHNKVSGRNAATRDDEERINKTQTFSPQNYNNNQPEMGKKVS